ncbi:unnamed protein product [Ambrosiozyma monospora]|uniref:Unnamed protein product n=1 Tax=Ambrosiozyma monospora TaxID=43982 RepID=A0A9W6Z1P5_AMBMO|nr:unnamed protein product [Ambrosiozyma monospora]
MSTSTKLNETQQPGSSISRVIYVNYKRLSDDSDDQDDTDSIPTVKQYTLINKLAVVPTPKFGKGDNKHVLKKTKFSFDTGLPPDQQQGNAGDADADADADDGEDNEEDKRSKYDQIDISSLLTEFESVENSMYFQIDEVGASLQGVDVRLATSEVKFGSFNTESTNGGEDEDGDETDVKGELARYRPLPINELMFSVEIWAHENDNALDEEEEEDDDDDDDEDDVVKTFFWKGTFHYDVNDQSNKNSITVAQKEIDIKLWLNWLYKLFIVGSFDTLYEFNVVVPDKSPNPSSNNEGRTKSDDGIEASLSVTIKLDEFKIPVFELPLKKVIKTEPIKMKTELGEMYEKVLQQRKYISQLTHWLNKTQLQISNFNKEKKRLNLINYNLKNRMNKVFLKMVNEQKVMFKKAFVEHKLVVDELDFGKCGNCGEGIVSKVADFSSFKLKHYYGDEVYKRPPYFDSANKNGASQGDRSKRGKKRKRKPGESNANDNDDSENEYTTAADAVSFGAVGCKTSPRVKKRKVKPELDLDSAGLVKREKSIKDELINASRENMNDLDEEDEEKVNVKKESESCLPSSPDEKKSKTKSKSNSGTPTSARKTRRRGHSVFDSDDEDDKDDIDEPTVDDDADTEGEHSDDQYDNLEKELDSVLQESPKKNQQKQNNTKQTSQRQLKGPKSSKKKASQKKTDPSVFHSQTPDSETLPATSTPPKLEKHSEKSAKQQVEVEEPGQRRRRRRHNLLDDNDIPTFATATKTQELNDNDDDDGDKQNQNDDDSRIDQDDDEMSTSPDNDDDEAEKASDIDNDGPNENDNNSNEDDDFPDDDEKKDEESDYDSDADTEPDD